MDTSSWIYRAIAGVSSASRVTCPRLRNPAPKLVSLCLLVAVWVAGADVKVAMAGDAPYHPKIDPANFQATIDNPYHPLVPGTTLKYLEKTGNETSENTVTVTPDTKMVMGVKCVVVHDAVTENGVLKEDTYDWYAQDKQGTVWYFGEATKEFKPGGQVSTEGSWEAGVNGQPGIIMPGHPKPGEPYRQEYSPGHAEDMGQVIAIAESTTVPAGSYPDCVRTKEWSLLDKLVEKKWYAKGVGVVRTESSDGEVVTLISVTRP